jgi:FkbM family methyltransferase
MAKAEEQVEGLVRPLRGVKLLRALHRLAPLGRKYHPLLSLMNPGAGLVAIPFDGFELVHPAVWRKYTTAFLLAGLNVVPEFRLLPPICRQLQAGCLVDVGANLGLYTLLLRSVSPLPIIAYEPQPFLFRLLQKNIAHNRLAKVKARNLACGAERGEIPFVIGINGAVAQCGPVPAKHSLNDSARPGRQSPQEFDWDSEAEITLLGHTVVKAPVVTLDEDLGDLSVALLKIDCEGFEQNILRGAQRLIARQRPHLFLELHPVELEKYGGLAGVVVEMLAPYYELEFWDFGFIRRRSRLVRSFLKHQATKGCQFADAREFLTACATPPRPSQLYVVGRPKRRQMQECF